MVRHFTRVWTLALLTMATACKIQLELGDDPQSGSPSSTSGLPDPNGQNNGLNETQQARKAEVDRYIADVIYKGGTVLMSLPLSSGDVIDLVDRNTLPQLPYPLPPLPFGPEAFALPQGAAFGLTELEQIPDYLSLASTAAPFRRPNFWPYIMGEAPDASSIEDYLQRYQEGGAPSTAKRLYAGLVSMATNRGVSGLMNQYRPNVEENTFSLMEFTVSCPADGPRQELIGIVISVDRFNNFGPNRQPYQDGEARMHIEYARMVNGKVQYVWDGMDGQFVDNPLRLHQPGEIVPVSVLNESIVEHLVAIFQVPSGDWWLAYNGDLLGYFPAKLFTMLKSGACRSAFYAEVLNKTNQPTTLTEMGSGKFSEAGLFQAAYIRNPLYYDLQWFAKEPKDEFLMDPYAPLCYNRTALTYIGAPTYSRVMILGGPGNKNPGCKWP